MAYWVRLLEAKANRVYRMYFMGIDTSCYTSSIAIVDNHENIIYDGRIMLEVPEKSRGLRQSEAVFQHSNNLPLLCSEAFNSFDSNKLSCIGVSTKPRSTEGSYMPVFTAGRNLAKIVSSCIKVPIVECSHQQGHMIAGAWSVDKQYKDKFLAYHISGGTTELLIADILSDEIRIIGGTEDLNAGQFIDRVGVSMGIKFPCGKEMDKLCKDESNILEVPLSIKNAFLSFSGPESHVQRLIQSRINLDDEFKSQIAASVFYNIARALEKTILYSSTYYNLKDVLLVGGVASNSIISQQLQGSEKARSMGVNISISAPHYSTDNAVGAAIYAKRAYQNFGGHHEQH